MGHRGKAINPLTGRSGREQSAPTPRGSPRRQTARMDLAGQRYFAELENRDGMQSQTLGAHAEGVPAYVLGCFRFGEHNPSGPRVWCSATRLERQPAQD